MPSFTLTKKALADLKEIEAQIGKPEGVDPSGFFVVQRGCYFPPTMRSLTSLVKRSGSLIGEPSVRRAWSKRSSE